MPVAPTTDAAQEHASASGSNYDPLNTDDAAFNAQAEKLFEQYSTDAPANSDDDLADVTPPAREEKPAKAPKGKAPRQAPAAKPSKPTPKAAAKPAAAPKTSTTREESPARSDAASPSSSDGGEEMSEFSPEALEMATSAGMSDDDLALFGSELELRRHLILEDRRRLNQARSGGQQQPPATPAPPNPAAKPAKQQVKAPVEPEDDDEEPVADPAETIGEGDDAISLNDWQDADDQTKRLVRAVIRQQKELSELRALKEHVAQSQQSEQQAKQQKFFGEFHAALNDIDPELFGSLDSENGQFVSQEEDEKRKQVFEAFRDMLPVFAKNGDPFSNVKAKIQRLYGALFPKRVLDQNNQQWRNRIRTQARRAVGSGGRRRASAAGMSRPTNGNGDAYQPEDLLTYDNPAIQELFEEHGDGR